MLRKSIVFFYFKTFWPKYNLDLILMDNFCPWLYLHILNYNFYYWRNPRQLFKPLNLGLSLKWGVSQNLQVIFCKIFFTNRVVQIKVYDRIYSLNQLINWFFYATFFFSLYIQTILFCKHVFRINGK